MAIQKMHFKKARYDYAIHHQSAGRYLLVSSASSSDYRSTGVSRVWQVFIIIEDEEEQSLNLPSDDYEIPLGAYRTAELTDRADRCHNPSMPERMMTGFLGDTHLVNGVPTPVS
ncbi:MAG: hypothetical protein U5K71_02880 [Gracilimonas sp.]|nr:hypothetical protein [Gracilimonas sp.]